MTPATLHQDSPAIRHDVIHTALRLQTQRVLPGTLGNFSVRLVANRVLITPSSRDYHTMQIDDLPIVSLDGAKVEGRHKPSVETKMHLAIYAARQDVGAIVHTHAANASTLAALGRPLPCILDELATFAKGAVRVAQYGSIGSADLAHNAVAALADRNAVMLAMHGLVTVGPDLKTAERVAEVVEHVAEVYLRMIQSV